MFKTIQNLAFFKLGWVACVMFAAAGKPSLSLLSVAIVAAIHLARVAVPGKEAFFLICAGLVGLLWETVVINTGLLEYTGTGDSAWLAPAWIIAMWVLFGTVINHGMSWLKRNWIIATLFGLIGGPLAFYSGSMMGAVKFTDTALALALLGAGWAILLPTLCLISDTLTDSQLLEPGSGTREGSVQLGAMPAVREGVASHG